jgi:transcriptional regulator with GAF, ATPase, and Fis domain
LLRALQEREFEHLGMKRTTLQSKMKKLGIAR